MDICMLGEAMILADLATILLTVLVLLCKLELQQIGFKLIVATISHIVSKMMELCGLLETTHMDNLV
jgi:hypothetical protein